MPRIFALFALSLSTSTSTSLSALCGSPTWEPSTDRTWAICALRGPPPPPSQPALIFSVLLAPDSLRSAVPCLSLRSRTRTRLSDQTTDRPTLDTRHSTPSGALPPPLARDPRAIRRTPPPLVRSPLNRLAQPCPGSQLPGLGCRSSRSRPLTSL